MTRRWRGVDSNHQFRCYGVAPRDDPKAGQAAGLGQFYPFPEEGGARLDGRSGGGVLDARHAHQDRAYFKRGLGMPEATR